MASSSGAARVLSTEELVTLGKNVFDAAENVEVDFPAALARGWTIPEGFKVTGRIKKVEIPMLDEIPHVDLINGEASDMPVIIVKPSINLMYHWVPVVGMEPDEATKNVDIFIKAHWAHMLMYPDGKLAPAHYRKAAIVLGTLRAAMTAFLYVDKADLIAGEIAHPTLIAMRTREGAYLVKRATTLSDTARAVVEEDLGLTETETAAIATMLTYGAGVPHVQGFSLINTSHHYISDGKSQSRKAFQVVEKGFWLHDSVKDFFSADTEVIQDVGWHKAAHPIHAATKKKWAMDAGMAEKLKAIGAAPCASRLPAIEAEVKAANAYQAVMNGIAPVLEGYGGEVDASIITDMLGVLRKLPADKTLKEVGITLAKQYPQDMQTRVQVVDFLQRVVETNSATAATAYGFYSEMMDHSAGAGGSTVNDTLKNSFALNKLKGTMPAAYFEGVVVFKDYMAFKNKLRQEGVFRPPTLVMKI